MIVKLYCFIKKKITVIKAFIRKQQKKISELIYKKI